MVANCIFGNWLGTGDTDTFLGLKSFWINKDDRTVKISVAYRTLGREIPAVPGRRKHEECAYPGTLTIGLNLGLNAVQCGQWPKSKINK